MALISIKRNVDLQPGLNAPAVFNCSQSDKGTTIMLGLMNGGNDYTVPSGVTITIRGSRSNGAVFTPVSATSSGSTVSFTLTEEMTDTAGPTLCEAVLEQGNNVLGTANFIINVEGSPMGADVPPVFTDAAWAWMLGKLTTETVPALGDDVISSIQGKVDKSQGSTNAKKFLRVNTSGNVSLASTDKTLSVWDQIADAKETGDQIRALDAEIDGVASTLGGSISTLNGITTDLQSSKLDKNQGASNVGKVLMVNQDGTVSPEDVDLSGKASESTIAPEFDSSTSYTAGSYVYKNGVLYRFTSAHTGAWTGTDAETVTVGGELTRLDNGSGSGLTEDVKVALLACFEKVAWIDEDGQDYYDALYDALYPSTNLVSISAVFNQGQNVIYVTDSLDTLKQYLTVTAYYSDSTTETISTYILSGTLTEGTSTITVSYGGKTTTFSVNVTRYVIYDYLYTSRTSGSGTNDYVSTDLVHTPSFNTLNVEFEAMNLNDESQADPLFCANNMDTSNTGNMVWYSRVNKGGFSAYNLGVAKQLNTVPGDTRATIKYFFVDGGESYMQYENTTVAVATMAKSAVATNNKTLMLAGGYSFTNGEKYGMRVGGKTKLGYIKFTDPDSGDIVYHFRPAHDLSTGKYGFLETINNHFYPDYDTYLRCGNWEA